jgi:hypothetical protein
MLDTLPRTLRSSQDLQRVSACRYARKPELLNVAFIARAEFEGSRHDSPHERQTPESSRLAVDSGIAPRQRVG